MSSSQILFTASTISDGNMSLIKGDYQEAVENRQRWLSKNNVDPQKTVFMLPTHEDQIILVNPKNAGKGFNQQDQALSVDGIVTNDNSLSLFTLVGDCMPVILYNAERSIIGLVHVGHRNLTNKTLPKAINFIRESFGTNPEELYVEIGPSIGPCCFKPVFPEKTSDLLKPYLQNTNEDQFSLDIWQCAEDQLIAAGIKPANLKNQKICTYHSGQYYSQRKYKMEELEHDYRFGVLAKVISKD